MDNNIAQLRELADELSNTLTYPNQGGCCVIAAEIAKYLSEIYPTSIRVSSDYSELTAPNVVDVVNQVRNPKDIYEWNDNGIFFGHVIVEFKYKGRKYHMDTNGVERAKAVDPSFGWILYPGEVPLESAKMLASISSDAWNSAFNRKQIPTLRKLVKQFFKRAQLT